MSDTNLLVVVWAVVGIITLGCAVVAVWLGGYMAGSIMGVVGLGDFAVAFAFYSV